MDDELGNTHDGLSYEQRRLLLDASDVLIDGIFADLNSMNDPDWSFADSFMAGFLPRRYLPRYTPLFAKQFFVCVVTVAWKLAQPWPPFPSCLAECLALRAVIQQAEVIAEMGDERVDLDEVSGILFEDLDFEYLFDNARDGLDQSIVGEIFGIESLNFSDWFTQYAIEGRGAVHPYAQLNR